LQGVAKPGAIRLSEQAYWQVKGRLDVKVTDFGPTQLKNITEPGARCRSRCGLTLPPCARTQSGASPAPSLRWASTPTTVASIRPNTPAGHGRTTATCRLLLKVAVSPDGRAPTLAIVCETCGRHGRYNVES
jgi:hypothetical protein